MASPESIGPDYDTLEEEQELPEESAAVLSPEQAMLVEQAGLEEAQGVAIVELIRSVLMEESDVDSFDTELA